MTAVHDMTAAELMAEAARREANRAAGRPLAAPLPDQRTPAELERAEGMLEKEIEHRADKQLAALGFEVIRFSHPGKTKQTPGIPDRRYYHRELRLVLWWEAKSDTGKQRPEQRYFQELAESCGDPYVLGTEQDLYTWLVHRGYARRCGFLLERVR